MRAGGRSHHPRHHPSAHRRSAACGAPFAASDGYALATARSTTSSTTPSTPRRRWCSTGWRPRWSRRSSSPRCWSAPASRSHSPRRCLRTRHRAAAPHLVEIHRLENEGDRLQLGRRRLAVRGRDRPDGRDPLEGHLRVAGGRRRRLRDGRTCWRGSCSSSAGAGARVPIGKGDGQVQSASPAAQMVVRGSGYRRRHASYSMSGLPDNIAPW